VTSQLGLVHHEMSRISRLTISELNTGLESQVHGGEHSSQLCYDVTMQHWSHVAITRDDAGVTSRSRPW